MTFSTNSYQLFLATSYSLNADKLAHFKMVQLIGPMKGKSELVEKNHRASDTEDKRFYAEI